ncbi:MAG TPA: hypothetical protein PLR99_30360, partial [Polyangiaceae bacterium]|nr:hypothetical protein [Polyangiaceae bacterium]
PATFPVVHAGKRPFLVLAASGARDAAGAELAEGAPRLVETDVEGAFAAQRAVAVGRLSDASRALVGRRVRLVGARGAVCEATVGEISLLERVYPDGEDYARWSGTALDDRGRALPRLSSEAIARELWRQTDADGTAQDHPLVAALRPVSGDCDGAVAASTTSDARPTLSTPERPSDALESQALRAFRALPQHARVEVDYETSWLEEVRALERYSAAARRGEIALGGERPEAPKLHATWDTHAEARPTVRQVVLGGETLVWVSATVGEGCGDFSAQLSALFRRSDDGALSVVRVFDAFASELGAVGPRAGGYALFFEDARADTSAPDVTSLAPRSFGCGC